MDVTTADPKQAVIDGEHLRLLSLFHYISGGLTVAFSLLFGGWMMFMGAMFAFMPPPAPRGAAGAVQDFPGPPTIIFAIFGALFLLGVAYGALEILAGRWISRRVRRVATLVVAIPRLAFLPYGVILSVFTLLVLERSTVKQLYRARPA